MGQFTRKEGAEAANKHKGNVWASVQDHVRNDPEVLEVFFRGEGEPCSLVIWVKIMVRKWISGHKVSREGVSPNPGKVREVKEWPTPKNKTELEAFLGLVNFYREHLDRFADTAACLYRLTGARVKFDWGEEEEYSLKN